MFYMKLQFLSFIRILEMLWKIAQVGEQMINFFLMYALTYVIQLLSFLSIELVLLVLF